MLGRGYPRKLSKKRFARASETLPDVLRKATAVTLETLSDLVAVAGFDGVAAPAEQSESPDRVGQ